MEYVLLASTLAAIILAGGASVGTTLQNSFSAVSHSLGQAAGLHVDTPGTCSQVAQKSIAQQDGKSGYAEAMACRMPEKPECLPRGGR